MSATINYKGATIATADNETKTLKTAGKYLEGDIIIMDETQGGAPKNFVMRPDAELIKTYQANEYIVADLGLTLPAYKTSAQTIKTGGTLGTITVDFNYDYFVTLRGIAIPIYSTETKVKGRCEYGASVYLYELAVLPANTIKTLDGSKAITSRNVAAQAQGSSGRELYWTSASAIAVANNTTYGASVQGQVPTISGTTLTIKAPNYTIRGNTTYMTSGAWSSMTDICEQYIINVWRAPKAGTNGWELASNLHQVIENVGIDYVPHDATN